MAAIGPATGERELAAAHQALMRTRGIQFDFAAAPRPPQIPHWLQVLLRWLVTAGPVLAYVFWIGVAVGAAMVLWLVVRDLVPARWRRRKPAPPPVDWRPAPEAARALLDEADALARDGRFGEAIHLILFRSIEDLAAKAPASVPRAFTSREIVAATPMPDRARDAFARIAHSVERSFFGGRAADAAEFDARRRDYEAFALEGRA